MVVTTKWAARPFSSSRVWGHVPPENFDIQKLGNVISSILGIKKPTVFVAFKNFSVRRCC